MDNPWLPRPNGRRDFWSHEIYVWHYWITPIAGIVALPALRRCYWARCSRISAIHYCYLRRMDRELQSHAYLYAVIHQHKWACLETHGESRTTPYGASSGQRPANASKGAIPTQSGLIGLRLFKRKTQPSAKGGQDHREKGKVAQPCELMVVGEAWLCLLMNTNIVIVVEHPENKYLRH